MGCEYRRHEDQPECCKASEEYASQNLQSMPFCHLTVPCKARNRQRGMIGRRTNDEYVVMQNPLPDHDVAGGAFVIPTRVQIAIVFRERRGGDDDAQKMACAGKS